MSRTTADWRGIIVEFDANETNTLLNTINPLIGLGGGGAIAAALKAMGVPAVRSGIIGAAIGVHLVWESAAIRAANRGTVSSLHCSVWSTWSCDTIHSLCT